MQRLFGLALFAACLATSPGQTLSKDLKGGRPVAVAVEAAGFSRLTPWKTRFDKLEWRGGLELSSTDKDFGGWSGLEISQDGTRIVAVGDQGFWFTAKLNYTDGSLSTLDDTRIAPLIHKSGKRSDRKSWRDAEALAAYDQRKTDGPLLVGFERRERIERFDIGKVGLGAKPKLVKSPKAISSGPVNGELEAIARLWSGPYAGWYVAISEKNFDDEGNIRGWRWRGGTTVNFTITRFDEYRITDMAILPGGTDIVTLERRFSSDSLPGMALRRFRLKDLQPTEAASGTLVLEATQPLFAIDNFEGLAVHQTADGETRLTMISDDNYNRTVQNTLLFQFALQD